MIYMDKKGYLISDESSSELHEFAHSIGLEREWFRYEEKRSGGLCWPHYEAQTDWMRYKAEKYGALTVSARTLRTMAKHMRRARMMGARKLRYQN